jgi:DNA invertase Pin-like site-specific DNA recombinase
VDTTIRRLLARTGVPTREIRADTTGDYGRNRTVRVQRVAGTPEEAGTAATLATPLVGGAVVAAVLIGMLMALLIVRRDAVAGMSIPLAHGVVAEGRTRVRTIGRFQGQVHALVLGRRGLARRQEARYLVSDPGTAKPFWVAHDEITRLVAVKPEQAGSARRAEPVVEGVRVVGYVSVPSANGGDDARLRKQAGKIDALCEERGWRLVEVVRDVEGDNSKGLHRPGLRYALDRIEKGEASCLAVSHLGRLTRSAGDLGRILEWLKNHGGRLVAIDVGLDTGSRDGDIAADALMSVSVWERRRLGERTRKGLAAARARGASAGRPAVSDVPELEARIVRMRAAGMTLQAIADQLNDEGVPTLRGGQKWRPSSVQAAAGYRRPGRPPGRTASSERSEDEL